MFLSANNTITIEINCVPQDEINLVIYTVEQYLATCGIQGIQGAKLTLCAQDGVADDRTIKLQISNLSVTESDAKEAACKDFMDGLQKNIAYALTLDCDMAYGIQRIRGDRQWTLTFLNDFILNKSKELRTIRIGGVPKDQIPDIKNVVQEFFTEFCTKDKQRFNCSILPLSSYKPGEEVVDIRTNVSAEMMEAKVYDDDDDDGEYKLFDLLKSKIVQCLLTDVISEHERARLEQARSLIHGKSSCERPNDVYLNCSEVLPIFDPTKQYTPGCILYNTDRLDDGDNLRFMIFLKTVPNNEEVQHYEQDYLGTKVVLKPGGSPGQQQLFLAFDASKPSSHKNAMAAVEDLVRAEHKRQQLEGSQANTSTVMSLVSSSSSLPPPIPAANAKLSASSEKGSGLRLTSFFGGLMNRFKKKKDALPVSQGDDDFEEVPGLGIGDPDL
jgi:uncharacterized protein YlaN (UPF0358 family)